MLRFTAIAALSLTLLTGPIFAQQSGGYPAVDSGPSDTTGPNPNPTRSHNAGGGVGGNAQTCTDGCNRSYEGCMDHDESLPGNEDTLRNSNSAESNLIGGASDCKDDLRKCLNTCGG